MKDGLCGMQENSTVKVVKFGGSSLADASQFKKVASIIKADADRRYVIPSALGKRFSGDEKVTDMLYECYDCVVHERDYSEVLGRIKNRYDQIIKELGLDMTLDKEFASIESVLNNRVSRDFVASRGEYLNGIILAKYLGFHFIDAADVIFFDEKGVLDSEKTNNVMKERLSRHKNAVIPGFYGSACD